MTTRHAQRGAFTLIELIAAILVMSIISSVVLPVVVTATQNYAEAASEREAAEAAAFAVDRAVRFVREIPVDDDSEAEIATIESGRVLLDDGSGLELSSGQLLLRDNAGTPHVLCDDVDTFELAYRQSDGVTATTDRAAVWTITVRLETRGVELRSEAFIRERVGG